MTGATDAVARRSLAARARRNAGLLRHAVAYELRKATVFRTGFFIREILKGVGRPLVTIFVLRAIFASRDIESMNGRSYPDLVAYMIMVMVLQKPLFDERGLELSEQIFEGYVTKYLVMPFQYFVLALGRWVQYALVQFPVAILLWVGGAWLLPDWWPKPHSAVVVGQVALLVLLGSYCYFQLSFIIHCLAFWLEVVWSLLVMMFFVTSFVGGVVLPLSVMPQGMQDVLAWFFPFWSLHAPVELWNGHMGAAGFATGVAVLGAWIAGLEVVRRVVWARGTLRYAGGGM